MEVVGAGPMLPGAREVECMKTMKLRLLLVGATVALIRLARAGIGGLRDPYATPPRGVEAVIVVLWK
jgi:hypothetical protein